MQPLILQQMLVYLPYSTNSQVKKGKLVVKKQSKQSKLFDGIFAKQGASFSLEPRASQHADAIKLLEWINEKNFSSTSPRFIQQYSPIREKQRRDKAIRMLIDHHYLNETKVNGNTILLINPRISFSKM